MKDTPLPLPNPGDWMTIGAAAHLMRVHPRTVGRLIDNNVLRSYAPYAAPDERQPTILWREEVLQVHAARQKLARTGDAS